MCGCCSKANLYVYTSLRTNQLYSIKQCKYGAITVSCTTSECSLDYTEVDYNTFKYNVQTIGVPLCNYVHHFSTASAGGACENPGLRRLDLDPYRDILPNITDNEDTDWTVDTHMSCATTAEGDGCDCNITTHASNSLGGDTNYPPYRANNEPLGINTRAGYNDALTLQVGLPRSVTHSRTTGIESRKLLMPPPFSLFIRTTRSAPRRTLLPSPSGPSSPRMRARVQLSP